MTATEPVTGALGFITFKPLARPQLPRRVQEQEWGQQLVCPARSSDGDKAPQGPCEYTVARFQASRITGETLPYSCYSHHWLDPHVGYRAKLHARYEAIQASAVLDGHEFMPQTRGFPADGTVIAISFQMPLGLKPGCMLWRQLIFGVTL